MHNLTCVQCIILQCVTDQRDAQFFQSIFFSTVFLSALHVSNESSHSTTGARRNTLYYTVWYKRAGDSARLACTFVPIVLCNRVYYAVLLMMND